MFAVRAISSLRAVILSQALKFMFKSEIELLPELWDWTFGFVDVDEIFKCHLVCRAWYFALNSPTCLAWKQIFERSKFKRPFYPAISWKDACFRLRSVSHEFPPLFNLQPWTDTISPEAIDRHQFLTKHFLQQWIPMICKAAQVSREVQRALASLVETIQLEKFRITPKGLSCKNYEERDWAYEFFLACSFESRNRIFSFAAIYILIGSPSATHKVYEEIIDESGAIASDTVRLAGSLVRFRTKEGPSRINPHQFAPLGRDNSCFGSEYYRGFPPGQQNWECGFRTGMVTTGIESLIDSVFSPHEISLEIGQKLLSRLFIALMIVLVPRRTSQRNLVGAAYRLLSPLVHSLQQREDFIPGEMETWAYLLTECMAF